MPREGPLFRGEPRNNPLEKTVRQKRGPLLFSRWGVFAFVVCVACGAKPPSPSLAARVNGESITLGQWAEERRFLGDPNADGTEALDVLTDQALLGQEGQRLGLQFSAADGANALAAALQGVDPDVLESSLKDLGLTRDQWQARVMRGAKADAAVEWALRGQLQTNGQEVQDRYWEHLLLYRLPPRRILRQIFTHTRSSAESALRELDMGEPFASVATTQGQGPEAANAGLLGPQSRAQLPKALAKGAWALKPGTYSPIVASHWGYHIFYLEGLLPGDPGGFTEAAPAARAALVLDKEQSAYRSLLARLRQSAVIEHFTVLEPPKVAPIHPEKGMS